MHIVSRKRLLEFSKVHPEVALPLDNWYRVAQSAKWSNINEVRQVYPSADVVGNFTIFNIKGNNYQLIVDIVYLSQRICIKYVLTHTDYDKEAWKNDPYY
jgi:mRNA interferase HigB